MTTEFMVFNGLGSCDYLIEKTEEEESTRIIYRIKRASNEEWDESFRGEKLLEIVDDGDGYIFNKRLGKTLDYSDMGYLFTLLSFIHKDNPITDGMITEKPNPYLEF